jgi:hypothetical protein
LEFRLSKACSSRKISDDIPGPSLRAGNLEETLLFEPAKRLSLEYNNRRSAHPSAENVLPVSSNGKVLSITNADVVAHEKSRHPVECD